MKTFDFTTPEKSEDKKISLIKFPKSKNKKAKESPQQKQVPKKRQVQIKPKRRGVMYKRILRNILPFKNQKCLPIHWIVTSKKMALYMLV